MGLIEEIRDFTKKAARSYLAPFYAQALRKMYEAKDDEPASDSYWIKEAHEMFELADEFIQSSKKG